MPSPSTPTTRTRQTAIFGNPGTDQLTGGGGLTKAWPAKAADHEYTLVRRSNTETLLVGGTLDAATPAQNATRELLPNLPNGHQVLLAGLGHTDDFWSYDERPEID
jgi:hypothetical protein